MNTLLLALIMIGSPAWVETHITSIPDFPKPGIVFRWYSKLLRDPEAFHQVIHAFADRYRDQNIQVIAGLDSRGFVFGSALAYELNLPFVMIRKAGKIPTPVNRVDYALEYGTSSFEIEIGSIQPGERVLIIDDLLATGGTAAAASQLVESLGGTVAETAFLIELSGLQGRDRIKAPVFSLVSIDAD